MGQTDGPQRGAPTDWLTDWLTGVDDVLAGDARVVDVVHGRREHGRQHLDVREHVLPSTTPATTVSPANTAEPIELPLGNGHFWGRGGLAQANS